MVKLQITWKQETRLKMNLLVITQATCHLLKLPIISSGKLQKNYKTAKENELTR